MQAPIHTLAFGQSSSMGSLLYPRGVMKSVAKQSDISRVEVQGTQSDIAIQASEILKLKVTDICAKHETEEGRIKGVGEDTFMSAEEGTFGIVDEIIVKESGAYDCG